MRRNFTNRVDRRVSLTMKFNLGDPVRTNETYKRIYPYLLINSLVGTVRGFEYPDVVIVDFPGWEGYRLLQNHLELADTNPDKFWMCYVGGRGAPRVFHHSEPEARAEAERLSRLPDNAGQKVFVLTATAYCITLPLETEWRTL